jgi:hypothetical protein
MEKQTKSLIGIGLLGVAAYWAYTQLSGEEETTIGGSGSFTGLGGGETGAQGALDNLTGTSDSGIAYNINLPSVDTGLVESILNEPTSGSGDLVTSPVTPTATKKEAVSSSKPTTSSGGGILDSIATSLSQVFGTESQKTNERGDYYTTAAGGGAGAIKGQSLGEMALNLLSGKTASGKSVDATLPTGASTASNPAYDLSGLTKSDLQKIVETDKAKKEEQAAAIAQTKIAAPTNTSASDIMSYLNSGGVLVNNDTGATISKKAATSTPSSSSSSSSSSSKKSSNTVSLSEASKGSSRFASQPSSGTGKVIKVKR